MTQRATIANTFKKVDIFGTAVSFNIGGQTTVNSILGACMSIFVVLMTLSYAYIRLQIMVDLDDSQHFKFEEISLEKEEFFNQTDTNFNVAFKVAKNYDWVAHEVDIEGYLVWEVTNWNWVPLFDENGVQTG